MTPRIEPEEQDFDPERFTAGDAEAAFAEGLRLFDAGEYHAAHEEFEKCWLANEGADADFFKGLIQAAICLHHFQRANLAGAKKLYSGHRRLLAPYLPAHRGLALTEFLDAMQGFLRPVLRCADVEHASVPFVASARPTLALRKAGGLAGDVAGPEAP